MAVRFTIVLLLLSLQVFTQTHRIDSLKRLLPSLTGPSEINVLNSLATEYYFYWLHSDSSFKYSDLAYKKASAIHYDAGKADALCIRAGVEGRLLGQPVKMETLARQAIEILKDENDPKRLSTAYYYVGVALTIQGKYHFAEALFDTAMQLAIQSKDRLSIGWAEQGIGFMYYKSGKYWKSFGHVMEAQQIGKEVNDSVLTTLSLAIIARTFSEAGDPQTALNYYYQAFQYSMPFIRLWAHHGDMAFCHLQLKRFDSAQYYQELNMQDLATQTTDPKIRKKFEPFSEGYVIDIQLAKKQYDSVLNRILPRIQTLRQTKDIFPYMHSLLLLARVYQAKGEHQTTLQYSRELYQVAKEHGSRRFIKNAAELLADVFATQRKGDSAYFYHKQYTVIKDSMETVQYAGRTALYLAASEAQNKIRLLEKDKEINGQQLALNKKELQKQAQLKNLLTVGIFMIILISILFFRNIILKRKNEKLRNEQEQSGLKRKAMELEMQALRAQMNPHFIFNCLSAIDNLIQTNQADKATTYLSCFAKLIRGVLDSSKNNLVPFQKDFETLKLYLEMEKFRCNDKFKYELQADADLLQGDYKVPPLLIQPFVENAIHHGLLNKTTGERQLQVKAELQDEHIIYSITDNGIGRKMAAQLKEMNKPGQQSYGIQITKERIQLHNRNGIDTDLVIKDLEEEGIGTGTEARVCINCYQS